MNNSRISSYLVQAMASTLLYPFRLRRPSLGAAAAVALLLDALFFVSGLNQTAIVPLLPRMSAAFGLGASASAFVLSLPALVTLAVSMPAGMLADRFGARRVTIASGAVLVLGCALGCGHSLPALIAGRAVYGVSFGMLWSAGAAWLAELGGGRRVGPAIVCSSVGTMVGPALGGLLAGGASGALPFALIAGAGVLVSAALALAPVAPGAAGAPRAAGVPKPSRGGERRAGSGVARHLRDRRIIAGAGSLAVSGALSGATQLLIAGGLHGDGVSQGAIGIAFSACAVAYIVVSSAFVAVGPRSHTASVNVIATGLAAIALVPALVSSAPIVLIASLLLTAAPRGAISVVAYSVAGSGAGDGQGGGGAVFGLLGGAWSGANVLTPLGAGALVQHAGAHVAYLAAIVPSVLITAGLLAALPRRPALARVRRRRVRRRGSLLRGRGAVGTGVLDGLQPAQLLERDVAADPVPRLLLDELRLRRLADLPDLSRAPRLERAARRRVRGARDLSLQPDPKAVEVVEARHR
jgi:MFS family permease